jgi:U3 small nucleolar RNA-associated protein 25
MSTDTEVKLLTLLNVAAIKKPRDLDIPGGQRGSPALNSRTASPVPAPALKSKGAKANGNGNGVKKRKSVIFGGELGPSGSTFGKKAKAEVNGKENGNNKGKGKEVNGTGNVNGNANGEVATKTNGHVDIDVDEGSDDEGAAVTSKLKPSQNPE